MIIHFEEQHNIFSGEGSTSDWALGVEGGDLIPPPELPDPDVGLVGDTSYFGTPGHAVRARLMQTLLE
jgi:hypothetical protein